MKHPPKSAQTKTDPAPAASGHEGTPKNPAYTSLRVCVNRRAGDLLPSCGARGSLNMVKALSVALAENGDFLTLERVHCLGRCHMGPTVKLMPGGPFLQYISEDRVGDLVALLKSQDYAGAELAFPSTPNRGDL